MQPKMCIKCKKNIAVLFITKIENGVSMNEGYCLKCARGLGIPQIEEAVNQMGKEMGITEEDLDSLSDEMSSMFAQNEQEDGEDDEQDSRTATFPLLSQMFGGASLPAKKEEPEQENGEKETRKKKS